MDTSNNTGLMGLLVRKMQYDSQRSAVLAENVANVSTPGYKARDLTAFTFGDAMKQASVGMATTDPKHIVPPNMAGVNASTVTAKTLETMPNGNSVDLETQMMEVSKTSVDYQQQISVYKKMMGMMKIALKGSSS